MASRIKLLLAFAFLLSAVEVGSSHSSPYLQVYPPVDETDERTPLYFALALSFGGEYKSIEALLGVQIALDYINSEPSILLGYTLHYTLTDSQCNLTKAYSNFHNEINFAPTKIGWIGSGCSLATEPTAALTQYYNITQVSCVSSSPELSNRQRYRYYFQMLATEVLIAGGFYGIIRNFQWKRVGVISQNENLFTESVDILQQSLSDIGVEVVEKRFGSDEGISSISQLFEPGIRIYVLTMFSPHARNILCEAYKRGLLYPKYMFITLGWYVNGWWKESNEGNCTPEQLARVIRYSLAPIIREIPMDQDLVSEPGITLADYNTQYKVLRSEGSKEIEELDRDIEDSEGPFVYSYHCHEGTLALAYALNLTIADLAENDTLNMEAAKQSGLSEDEDFTMANFTYANSAVVSRMFEHLKNTMFLGITGNEVKFDADGIRDIDTVAILQYQNNQSGDSLIRPEVATVTGANRTVSFVSEPIFPDGVPNDGIPLEEVVTVSLLLTVIYIIFAVAGIAFSIVCVLFTLVFKKRKLIRLSSPNLNYIIGLGAVILYLNVITLVIPTTDHDFAAVLCNINPWLISLGYSLCFGTIIIKMIRVWIIFSNPLESKASFIQDYLMALFVLCLAIIDIVILLLYTATEGTKDNLGVRLAPNRELPEETFGATAEHHKYYLYVCESSGLVVMYAVLFGYKGVLQAIALLLAFRTRHVKVKGLDDSVYIAASIYVTSIVLAVIIVSTYTLRDYVNAYPAVVGMGLLLGTTMILGLVFIPRMVGLYKDPKGETVTTFHTTVARDEAETANTGKNNDSELKKLRRRVIELENSIKKQTSDGVSTSPVLGMEIRDVSSVDNKKKFSRNGNTTST